MTFSASTAYQLSQNAATVNTAEQVYQEIAAAEARIQNAATRGVYELSYSAVLVGNPPSDPSVDSSLTTNQLAFRNAMQTAGYLIGRNLVTSEWTINWAQQGPEDQVTVYEIRTSVTPGPVQSQTITALDAYFAGLNPLATDRIMIAGSAISGTYVHLAIVHQQNTTNLSSGVLAALTGAGLGYSGGNTSVSKRT